MGHINYITTVLAVCALSAAVLGQGGQAGGATGGGGFGGGQAGGGTGQATYTGKLRQIDARVNSYLDTSEVKSILTPGEFNEWTLTLTAGQVVIADARSDAFDPALQIVFIENEGEEDEKIVIHVENDDRFPGDQRPLIIWRCEEDGVYRLRARCFQDKSGGQFFLRSKTYESLDLTGGEWTEMKMDGLSEILLKVPMKAGEIKQVVFESPNSEEYMWATFQQVISPIGLPDIQLTRPMSQVMSETLMAAVDGDYYVVARTFGREDKKIRVKTREIPAVAMGLSEGVYTSKAPTSDLALRTLSVKKGDIIEVSTPELFHSSLFVIAEYPDISEYDLKDPKTNPFFPQPLDEEEDNKGPAFVELPGRARDRRIGVFVARRDAELWLASSGAGPRDTQYTLRVGPAAKQFSPEGELEGQLGIGYTDYWEFEAVAGDVMTFKSEATGFAQVLRVLDPDLNQVWSSAVNPDQTSTDWNMIVKKPGRYLVAVSAIGDGGGGTYTLNRQVFSAREFGKDSPAKGNFSTGQAEVWKFTATPDEPLLIHWESSNRSYTVSIRDESGAEMVLPLTLIDGKNQFGVLKVSEETTYVIVLISNGSKPDYTITLSDILDHAKGG